MKPLFHTDISFFLQQEHKHEERNTFMPTASSMRRFSVAWIHASTWTANTKTPLSNTTRYPPGPIQTSIYLWCLRWLMAGVSPPQIIRNCVWVFRFLLRVQTFIFLLIRCTVSGPLWAEGTKSHFARWRATHHTIRNLRRRGGFSGSWSKCHRDITKFHRPVSGMPRIYALLAVFRRLTSYTVTLQGGGEGGPTNIGGGF